MLSLFSTNDGRLYLPAKTQNWTSSHGIVGSRLTMWPSNVWSLVGKVTPHLVKLSVTQFFGPCWLLVTFLNEALLLSGSFLWQGCHKRFSMIFPTFFRTHKSKQIWWHSAFPLSTPAILWNPFCFWLCNATHLWPWWFSPAFHEASHGLCWAPNI